MGDSAKPVGHVPANSPAALALGRFWSRPGARWAVRGLLAILVLGIYAPFLCSESALLWRDQSGWSVPIFTDLFNLWTYPKHHDLFFNIVALLLPFLLIAGWFLRRRWSLSQRIFAGTGLALLAWVGAMLPLVPTSTGNWQPLWRRYTGAGGNVPTLIERRAAVTDWERTPADERGERPAAPPTFTIFPAIPHSYEATYANSSLLPPLARNRDSGARFWGGTDSAGHDVAARMLFGIRIGLSVGVLATLLSMGIGVFIGALSGFMGGWIDLILQRVVEIMMCFPRFILVLVVVAMWSRDIFVITFVLGLVGWADTARLVRGEFLAQSVRDYVSATRALGLPRWRIMFRHILPNTITPLLIGATFGIAGAVGAESGLAFLGLGDLSAATWGGLLNQGRNNITCAWLIYFPGLGIFVLVALLNLIGNGLREAFDVRAS